MHACMCVCVCVCNTAGGMSSGASTMEIGMEFLNILVMDAAMILLSICLMESKTEYHRETLHKLSAALFTTDKIWN